MSPNRKSFKGGQWAVLSSSYSRTSEIIPSEKNRVPLPGENDRRELRCRLLNFILQNELLRRSHLG